ncbi:hypothetical protein O6H91_08G007600 [Diphasiastrum complanatum]|uniref:Uncharacterized protein n=1 Tax=Diphasiastrum complanatum TaxID=34168 RepID=A0ACC2CUU0_DIPCM|nr:hypothetical protein O6H91_08G007600 [Diphasiastrum complanatum]
METFITIAAFLAGMVVASCFHLSHTQSHSHGTHWKRAHATFYGESDASGTMDQDGCGYDNIYIKGLGFTSALSPVLFKEGASCGGCYEIMCLDDNRWCNAGNPSVTITVTHTCSPADPNDGIYGGDVFYAHFNMSKPAFSQISSRGAGYVAVLYRRVPCMKQGGIQFTLNGSPWSNLVLVSNVAGEGEVSAMSVKGSQTGWISMKRKWGQNWECDTALVGQSLSFQVTTSDGKQATSYNVVPSNWQFGQTFSGNQIY